MNAGMHVTMHATAKGKDGALHKTAHFENLCPIECLYVHS